MIQINTKIADKERDGVSSKKVIYQFKATLSRVRPAVWRRVEALQRAWRSCGMGISNNERKK